MCPSQIVDSIAQIDILDLNNRNISALLVDLDNTLVPWQGYNIQSDVTDWLQKVRKAGVKVCIVSNTRPLRRLRQLAKELDVPHVRRALKPRRGGFRDALSMLGVDPSQAAVVGDQIFTDILGGNRLGLYTILVRPILGREFFGTKISRVFERMLLKVYTRAGMLASPSGGDGPTEDKAL